MVFLQGTASSTSTSPSYNLRSTLVFDSAWNPETPSLFIKQNDHYELKVDIQSVNGIQFPLHLDASTPILIKTRHGEVRQYLVSKARYESRLAGRYLVYLGEKNAVLYRYDTDTKSLREFVWAPSRESLSDKGEIIHWRFEGATLHLHPDGRVTVNKIVDIKKDVEKIADNNMAERISRFFSQTIRQECSSRPAEPNPVHYPAPGILEWPGPNIQRQYQLSAGP